MCVLARVLHELVYFFINNNMCNIITLNILGGVF